MLLSIKKYWLLYSLLTLFILSRLFILNIYFSDPNEEGLSKAIYSIIAPESFKLHKKSNLSTEDRLIGTSDSRKHIVIAKNLINFGLPFYSLIDFGYFVIQPGYSFFLALFFAIGLGIKSILVAQVLLVAISLLMLYQIIVHLTKSKLSGYFSLIIIIFYPSLIWIETNIWAESIYVFLVTSFIYLYFQYFITINSNSNHCLKLKLILMGLSIGLACIVRPVATLFPFFIVSIHFFYYRNLTIKQKTKLFLFPALFSLLGILIIMLPWSIYAYRMTGVIVWGSGGKVRGKLTNIITNESGNLKKLGKIESPDQVKDESFAHCTIEYLKNIPIRFARLWLGINYDQKISYKNKVLIGATSLLWILAIIGLYYLIRSKNYLAVVFLFSFVLYVTLIHQIIGQRLRYSIPSLYYLIAIASYGLVTLSQKLRLLLINRKTV